MREGKCFCAPAAVLFQLNSYLGSTGLRTSFSVQSSLPGSDDGFDLLMECRARGVHPHI